MVTLGSKGYIKKMFLGSFETPEMINYGKQNPGTLSIHVKRWLNAYLAIFRYSV